jgi:hypothetical protein
MEHRTKSNFEKRRQDRLAIQIAAFAAFISLIAAIFTGLQWADARHSLFITQRPWVGANIDPTSTGRIVSIRNSGLTTALKVRPLFTCSGKAGYFDANVETPFDYGTHFLVPGETLTFACDVEPAKALSCVDGVVEYEDVFGKPHHTWFCRCFRPKGNDSDLSPETCRYGNNAD